MALRWVKAGAELIHLVDLDGALGQNQENLKAIESIRRMVRLPLQLGGGLKSLDRLKRWFDLGIDRLVMGTAICLDPALVEKACQLWPGKVAAALDASNRALKVWGWQQDGGLDLLETAARLKDMGLSLIIHTDVDRDGAQIGPNIDLVAQVAQVSQLPTIVSGGVSGLEDLKKIKQSQNPLFYGVISGKALYEGSLDFAQGQAVLAAKGSLSDDAPANA
jgi:phosphoribosylformimino-5-aminoimidazole carboxamide ribotide isomerase